MSHSASRSCAAKGCSWGRGWAQMLPWGRGLQWCQRLGAPLAAGQTASPVPGPCSCNDQMSQSDLTPLGSPIASKSIWQRCQITSLSVHFVAQLASGKMEGERQNQDLGWCNVFLFILCQAALDHALACQNGFAGWLGCARGTLVCRSTHLPAAPLLGVSHKDPLGAWLLPSCCSSVSPCRAWLSTYRHRLLLLHFILLLVPDTASYLSENETWTSPLCACVLRTRVAAGVKAEARLVQLAKSHQTSLLPCSLNVFLWLGHPSPTSFHCCGCSCLLHWLPFPSQGKCISPSSYPSLLCMLICQLCQTQKRIFDCSNVLMRAECSVIPLSNTSCVLITHRN